MNKTGVIHERDTDMVLREWRWPGVIDSREPTILWNEFVVAEIERIADNQTAHPSRGDDDGHDKRNAARFSSPIVEERVHGGLLGLGVVRFITVFGPTTESYNFAPRLGEHEPLTSSPLGQHRCRIYLTLMCQVICNLLALPRRVGTFERRWKPNIFEPGPVELA
jgi:hypothetical protein